VFHGKQGIHTPRLDGRPTQADKVVKRAARWVFDLFQHFNEHLEGEEDRWLWAHHGACRCSRQDRGVSGSWRLGVPSQCGAGRDRSSGEAKPAGWHAKVRDVGVERSPSSAWRSSSSCGSCSARCSGVGPSWRRRRAWHETRGRRGLGSSLPQQRRRLASPTPGPTATLGSCPSCSCS
jgi:hypothetical protein